MAILGFTILRRDPDWCSTGTGRTRRRGCGSVAGARYRRRAVGVGEGDRAAGETTVAVGDFVQYSRDGSDWSGAAGRQRSSLTGQQT